MENYNFNCTPLNLDEMMTIDGGWIGGIFISIAFAIAWDSINDPEGTSAACAAGRNRALNMY